MKLTALSGAASLLILAACASSAIEDAGSPADILPPPAMDAMDADPARIQAAVADANRPETDVERDDLRKPAEVLAFMDIAPGSDILEMEAGGGYFTEIFSRYVGEDGTVFMQNPAAFDGFLGDGPEERATALGNVEYVKAQFDDLPLDDESVDAATWFQGPHELWYAPPNGEPLVASPDDSFPEIFRVLKPGGTFVVLDHTAPEGSPATIGGDTHRIDPQIVRDLAREAGFVLIMESELFDNADDDLTANVFDEAVRGRTDQFLMKFEKPASAPAS